MFRGSPCCWPHAPLILHAARSRDRLAPSRHTLRCAAPGNCRGYPSSNASIDLIQSRQSLQVASVIVIVANISVCPSGPLSRQVGHAGTGTPERHHSQGTASGGRVAHSGQSGVRIAHAPYTLQRDWNTGTCIGAGYPSPPPNGEPGTAPAKGGCTVSRRADTVEVPTWLGYKFIHTADAPMLKGHAIRVASINHGIPVDSSSATRKTTVPPVDIIVNRTMLENPLVGRLRG